MFLFLRRLSQRVRIDKHWLETTINTLQQTFALERSFINISTSCSWSRVFFFFWVFGRSRFEAKPGEIESSRRIILVVSCEISRRCFSHQYHPEWNWVWHYRVSESRFHKGRSRVNWKSSTVFTLCPQSCRTYLNVPFLIYISRFRIRPHKALICI